MVTDARISAELPNHPKTKKLIRRLGQAAGWNLTRLFLWAAANRSDGELCGMTDEDIELAVDWLGEGGQFVRDCVDVGFLDGEAGNRAIHDWETHNPWAAGTGLRSAKARWNAVKRHHGEAEADRKVPEYVAVRIAGSTAAPIADSTLKGADSNAADAASTKSGASSNAPSPYPSPSPSPLLNTPLPPKGGRRAKTIVEDPDGFAAFWAEYRRKDAKPDAVKAWKALAPDAGLQAVMLASLRRWAWREEKQFNPLPASWIRGERWRDESVTAASSVSVPAWVTAAGFTCVEEAANFRCHAGNYREFADGQRITEGAGA